MMGQQDPAPVNIVSGSAGWRRGLGGMPNPLAKTEEDSLRAPLSAAAPSSSWTGGGGESGTVTGAGHALWRNPLLGSRNPDLAPLKQMEDAGI